LNLKRLFSGQRDAFGLDIGSSYIKAVQLHRDESGYNVMAAGRVEVVQDDNDDHAKIDNLVTAIRKCVKSAQIKTKYAVCGVCGPNVAVRRFEFSTVGAKGIDQMVLAEAEQVCPFDQGQFIIDYQLIHNGRVNLEELGNSRQNNKTLGVLVAATTDIIGRKNQLARAASLNCVLMDVDGLALLNCFLECEKLKHGKAIAILSFGNAFTNLVISSENGLPFVRDIPHGADEIIDRISGEYNLSSQAVRNELYSSPDKDKNAGKFRGSIETGTTKLIGDIKKTLRYYAAQGGNATDKMFVCGDFAQADGFVESLNNRLGLQVVLWNPFDKIRRDVDAQGAKILQEHGCSLAVATGLAMRTI
jgi:type IV pilus assembly protein PilM